MLWNPMYFAMGYLAKGIVDVLNSFGHEQYPSNSINPWCLLIEYN
jgi:hypothetical protein